MKKVYLFLTLITLVIVTSCKKGNDVNNDGESFMKFKMDGSQINWTEGFAEHLNTSLNIISANGFSSTQSTAETMTIGIANDGPIDTEVNYSYPTFNVRMNYTDANNVHYASNDDQASIRVTSETSTSISGTFTGKVKNDDGDEKIITDGIFTLQKPT